MATADASPQAADSGPRVARAVMLVVAVSALVTTAAVLFLTDDFLGGGALPDSKLEASLNILFDNAAADESVHLAAATSFGWDAVGVFGPYYPHESIVEDMGIDVPTSVTNWTQSEGNCLVVFRSGDQMAAWSLVRRSVADCSGRLSGRVYPRADARFRGDAFRPVKG